MKNESVSLREEFEKLKYKCEGELGTPAKWYNQAIDDCKSALIGKCGGVSKDIFEDIRLIRVTAQALVDTCDATTTKILKGRSINNCCRNFFDKEGL